MNTQKILIIEDEEILIDVLQKRIKQEGYDVFLARDGEEGIEKIKEVKPDLILLDIIMPKKNGFEVLEEMKKDQNIANIPVIIISNSGQSVEIDRAFDMGIKDYLVKTQFDPAEVIEKITKQLVIEEAVAEKESKGKAKNLKIKSDNSISKKKGGHKILIIEDDKFLQDLIAKKLISNGLETITASDGPQGVKTAEEKMPDLIILDLMLPGMDGFEILRQLKDNPNLALIPVIILSNLGQKEDVEKGLGLGAKDFLIKAHFTPKEIIEKVKNYLPR